MIQRADQETQVWSGRQAADYVDNQPAGSGMESPGSSDENLLWDLNNLRSQIARILDPATPAKYAVSVIPTVILFKGGKEVERFVGVSPKAKATYTEALDKALG